MTIDKNPSPYLAETYLSHCQASLVAEASAETSETKLSSAVEDHSSHRRQAAANEPSAQSSQHRPAGTTDPSADPTPASHTDHCQWHM